jgi:hypothetical protein
MSGRGRRGRHGWVTLVSGGRVTPMSPLREEPEVKNQKENRK